MTPAETTLLRASERLLAASRFPGVPTVEAQTFDLAARMIQHLAKALKPRRDP